MVCPIRTVTERNKKVKKEKGIVLVSGILNIISGYVIILLELDNMNNFYTHQLGFICIISGIVTIFWEKIKKLWT